MAKAKKAAKKAATKKAAVKKAAVAPTVLNEAAAELNSTILNTVYVVDDSNNEVTLEVIAGEDGQQSDMDITLDNKILADKIPDSFPETAIGKNKKLQRKTLRIRVIITDVLPDDSNVTSLTIILKGGGLDATFPLGKTVGQNGSAQYICKIEFL